MFGNRTGLQGLLKEGGRHFAGVDEAVLKNIEACKHLAGITRTSLGPHGTNKLIINHIGKHYVTSDTSTIVQELEVMHPAAKLIVMAARAQEGECGDATNLVCIFAGELLKQAEDLLKEGLHASDILKGYEMAKNKLLELLPACACWTVEDLHSEDQLKMVTRTPISAKQLGLEDDISKWAAEACKQVMPQDCRKFDVDCVRVAKIPGASLTKSYVVCGMVAARDTSGTQKLKKNAKVAVYGGGIESQQTETKGTVLIENAEQLMDYTKGEEGRMDEFIKGLKDAGVDVVISGGAISDIAMHYLNKYELLVLKITSKFELRRFCKTVGATSIIRAGAPYPEELGFASFEVKELSGAKITVVTSKDTRVSTIVLRGATGHSLAEIERTIDDAAMCVKSAGKDPRFVAGAGACEIELALGLQRFGATVPGLEQYAVLKFAEALEVVPKVLAENAGHSRLDAITGLYAAHEKGDKNQGIDVEKGSLLIDAKKEGIVDHLETKSWAIRFAVDAVLTILRVDQIIMAKQAGGPKGGPGGGRDDD